MSRVSFSVELEPKHISSIEQMAYEKGVSKAAILKQLLESSLNSSTVSSKFVKFIIEKLVG